MLVICEICGLSGAAEPASPAERSKRFNDTTGKIRGGNDHPDRCVCQRKETGPFADTPHVHYDEPPFKCARCDCEAYEPEVAEPASPAPKPCSRHHPSLEAAAECARQNAMVEPDYFDKSASPAPDPLSEAIEALAPIGRCVACSGKGQRYKSCSLCGDSTYDHLCDDQDVACEACGGSGKSPAVEVVVNLLRAAQKEMSTAHSRIAYLDAKGREQGEATDEAIKERDALRAQLARIKKKAEKILEYFNK